MFYFLCVIENTNNIGIKRKYSSFPLKQYICIAFYYNLYRYLYIFPNDDRLILNLELQAECFKMSNTAMLL